MSCYLDNYIEITYSVFGFDEVGETTFDMDVSEDTYNRLLDLDEEGEVLDSEYMSENMRRFHKKILKAIRANMYDESLDPDDGMIEKKGARGFTYKSYDYDASHDKLFALAEDDDIEYTITV